MVCVIEVALEPVCQGSFGLSHILLGTYFACDCIYEVGAFAGNILFASVFLPCDVTFDFATCVYFGAISAFFVGAYIGGFGSNSDVIYRATSSWLAMCVNIAGG